MHKQGLHSHVKMMIRSGMRIVVVGLATVCFSDLLYVDMILTSLFHSHK